MAVSSDPPAVGATPNEAVANEGTTPTTKNGSALKTTNTAPLAGSPAPETAAIKTSEQPTTSLERPEEEEASLPPSHNDHNGVNPLDFEGSVASTNDLPSPSTLRKIENYVVLDRDGKSHPFKSLYTGKHVARRVLVIFVRHFFCGNCQEYLRTLSAAITPDSLLRLPISTFIAVVGCGDPALIPMYAEATGCPFPIYADPTRRLYQELGMVRTLALGERPAYMKKSLLKSSIESIVQGLKQIPKGLATKAGDQRQIGGEFLFEPLDLATPMGSPLGEAGEGEKRLGVAAAADGAGSVNGSEASLDGLPGTSGGAVAEWEPKRVTWCHRMRTTRDHAEIPELMEVLGLDMVDAAKPPRADEGKADKEGGKRWSRALEMRKGTGLSMAGQMSAMKADAAVAAPAPLGGQT
ncbi:Thioredoxin-like protein AAED1 [Coniochaeta hoffmannii]|uniref:Thioredoxin-like protein AAED1 n=1 Tax=Coniochaeta hoffmannii TaxID=91930 RepID=A0AA38RM23_9PEZI|nr:Thioredoxin-like protein AAED1 [Coniochaeta hoffmannii]